MSAFTISRTTTVDAPPGAVRAEIEDFRSWREWSPWEDLDPRLSRTYSGPDAGVGAVYEWVGNRKAGAGRMEITDTSPPSKIVIKLDFISPFEGHNIAEFTMQPKGDATTVTWAMS